MATVNPDITPVAAPTTTLSPNAHAAVSATHGLVSGLLGTLQTVGADLHGEEAAAVAALKNSLGAVVTQAEAFLASPAAQTIEQQVLALLVASVTADLPAKVQAAVATIGAAIVAAPK